MLRRLQRLHAVILKLSEPTEKYMPDPQARRSLWKKNTANLYIFIVVNIVFTLMFVFADYSSTMNTMNLVGNLIVLILFLILCRSYLWVFNIFHASIVSFAPYFLMDYFKELVYFYLGYAFSLPPFILMLSGNVPLAAVTGAMQIVIFQTKFKEAFVDTINTIDAQTFADQFIGATAVLFGIMLFANLFLLRTLDKKNIELAKAKKVAEDSVEQQRTFIFSFSHELRNPINSLLGNLNLVLSEGVSPNVTREMIQVAKVCGELLLQAINNVLDTGKYEMGNLEVNPVPTKIHELFQRSWGIYNELLKQKQLQSFLKIEKRLPATMKIDSHKLNQILLNLIGNSIKFTEKGSINVTVKWLREDTVNEACFEPIPYDDIDEGLFEKEENLSTMKSSETSFEYLMLGNERRKFNYDEVTYPQDSKLGVLKVIVKDTGCGMKKDDLAKLFKKFSQVSEDAGARQIGTGLGLFITNEICRAMGGEIRAYSKPKKGSTFIVCIPAMSIPAVGTLHNRDSGVVQRKLVERKLKAIVADDSPFNVSLTCNYFSKIGAAVAAIGYNGYDAYMRYRECVRANVNVEMITLDIDMPIMDGKKVCDKIREYEKENNLRPIIIVLISGNYDKEQINEYLDTSKGVRANYYLKKPVSFEDFKSAVYSLLYKD